MLTLILASYIGYHLPRSIIIMQRANAVISHGPAHPPRSVAVMGYKFVRVVSLYVQG